MNSLIGILIRFRKEQIVLVADVEQMFHQVRVNPKHRDALRFLWWPDGDLEKEPQPYHMNVHIFGAKSSPCCANFCLRQTAVEFGHLYDPLVSKFIRNSFYVDDCLVSVSTVREAILAQKYLREILAKRGFRLRKWISNNDEVLRAIPESECSTARGHALDDTIKERLLGMRWKLKEDSFTFEVNLPQRSLTRRGILSALSSLYDPLGFVSPVILEGKLLLQALYKGKALWDEEITSSEAHKWLEWISCLPTISNLRISRCVKPKGFSCASAFEIHNFSDASSYAYGACSYLRIVNEKSQSICSFIIGKARLAPIKPVSIPRLELTTAVLAVRLNNVVVRELDAEFCVSYFWTDSIAVLHCIKNKSKRFPPFVANRLSLIEIHTEIDHWRYIPSAINPADIASREASAEATSKLQTWLDGPSFLSKPTISSFGDAPLDTFEPTADFLPLRKQEVFASFNVENTDDQVGKLISRCSSMLKLKRIVAWVLRVKSYQKGIVNNEQVNTDCDLSASELHEAEISLIKYVQSKHFSCLFSKSKANFKSLSRNLLKLSPYVHDDGISRVGGRLNQTSLAYDLKHPILLPKDSQFTELLIRQHHQQVGHSGASHTWSCLRQRFWIVKGAAAVRKTIGKCVLCKKRNSKVGEQFMSDIPNCRLQYDQPSFCNVGIDFFGPLPVKFGRSIAKRYGCVFTCLTMRAVHIEIAHSLDTHSSINALRRFIARRGKPLKIFSDNGTNFVGAEKVLRDALLEFNANSINQFCSQEGICWTFNPSLASHMGGSWERMIRTIRKIFQNLLGSQVLNNEGLFTLMAEVESVINSRPLVPISFSDTSQEPLTPNHLLLLRATPNLPPGLFCKEDCYSKRRWAQVQFMANQFWRSWLKEFLPNLLHRQK